MAIEDPPGGVRPLARPFSLIPPPRDQQFRTAQLKVERSQRKAERRREAALEVGEVGRAGYTPELARLWASAPFRELRRDLPPHEAEKLHQQLAAFLSGEGSVSAWHATLFALREARRAAEIPAGVHPRKWRQSFSSFDYW